jgi:hypothetical protein
MIVLLTYDHEHRKTTDVLWRMIAGGNRPGAVVALPWVNRKKQRGYIYGHRPAEKNWPCEPIGYTHDICAKLGIEWAKAPYDDIQGAIARFSPSVVVIGGAGILPHDVVTKFTVVNVHPGLLPARRGLDVFKWAINDLVQVGVTAHICDERTDLGRRLIERQVPVFPEDSLQSFAMRQYEYELGTINGAIEMVKAGVPGDPIHPGETKPYGRMPLKIEATLLQRFEDYKRVYAA